MPRYFFAQLWNVPIVTPLLVAPPGSTGSFTKPPSCFSNVGKKASKLAMVIYPLCSRVLLELPRRLLQLPAARLRQISLHARREQRRERSVPGGVGLITRLRVAKLDPRLLCGAQLVLAALVVLRLQAPVGRVHAVIRAFQPGDLALAHRRGARGVLARGALGCGLGQRRRARRRAQPRDERPAQQRKAHAKHAFATWPRRRGSTRCACRRLACTWRRPRRGPCGSARTPSGPAGRDSIR